MVLMVVTPVGEICAGSRTLFNSKFRWRKCYELKPSSSTVFHTFSNLFNQIVPQSTPVEGLRLGWTTIAWTLWTGHRVPGLN
uniref:Secreted protein n=1 Tax=Heterorhabditis bacteriophora TaxID=37862 RepID=A0A1I7WAK8_HETBA